MSFKDTLSPFNPHEHYSPFVCLKRHRHSVGGYVGFEAIVSLIIVLLVTSDTGTDIFHAGFCVVKRKCNIPLGLVPCKRRIHKCTSTAKFAGPSGKEVGGLVQIDFGK